MFTRTVNPNDKHIYYCCNECGEYLKVDELLWLHHQDAIIKYLKHTCIKSESVDHQRYENYFKQFMDKYFNDAPNNIYATYEQFEKYSKYRSIYNIGVPIGF